MSHEVETLYVADQPAWHGLGNCVQGARDSAEALQLAGLDWRVAQERMVLEGTEDIVPGHYAVVRDTDRRVLGVVGPEYRVLQNHEGFEILDLLAGDDTPEPVLYESAGALNGGRRVFMMARIQGDYQILDDKVQRWLAFASSHDGSLACTVGHTPLRIECANTLRMWLQGANNLYTFRHSGDINAKLDQAAGVLGMNERYMTALRARAEELARVTVSESRWFGIVDELCPIPAEATKRATTTAREKRALLYPRLFVPNLENYKHNGWGVVQAVMDYDEHAPGQRITDRSPETRLERIAWGTRPLVDRAVELVLN